MQFLISLIPEELLAPLICIEINSNSLIRCGATSISITVAQATIGFIFITFFVGFPILQNASN